MGAALPRRTVSAFGDEELLLETCDALSAGRAGCGQPRSYSTKVPWDVPLRLAATSLCVVILAWAMVAVPELYEFHRIPPTVLIVGVALGLLFGAAMVISQIPRKIVRKADELVIEFILHSHRVPLGDVLELVMLKDGSQFWQLLRRWKDPVQFLLDNQKPLVLEANYRTTFRVAVREGEAMSSNRVGNVPKGRYVKVLEQRGRRVLVQVEGSDVNGWMSYLSVKGVALLAKDRGASGEAEPGMIGASELSRSDDGPLELGLLPPGRVDGVE